MHGKIRVPPPMPSVSASSPSARIKFWGTRGSIAVPGPETLRYGGNTTCVEIRADGEIIVLDAGSGTRALGIALDREFQARPIRLSLLITHAHWDHIQGFPFFKPAYDSKSEIRIFGFDGAGATFREIMTEPMKSPFFPITMRELSAKMDINKLNEMKFSLGKLDIHAALVQFLRGSDILILDTQYTDQEYTTHIGWGHGSISSAVSLALEAEVQTLLLFHHDPSHDDKMVDKMVESARELAIKSGRPLQVTGAQEGRELLVEAKTVVAA